MPCNAISASVPFSAKEFRNRRVSRFTFTVLYLICPLHIPYLRAKRYYVLFLATKYLYNILTFRYRPRASKVTCCVGYSFIWWRTLNRSPSLNGPWGPSLLDRHALSTSWLTAGLSRPSARFLFPFPTSMLIEFSISWLRNSMAAYSRRYNQVPNRALYLKMLTPSPWFLEGFHMYLRKT